MNVSLELTCVDVVDLALRAANRDSGIGTVWPPEVPTSFAITSTSWLPVRQAVVRRDVLAICFAAPRPPPLGFHDDHAGAGIDRAAGVDDDAGDRGDEHEAEQA